MVSIFVIWSEVSLQDGFTYPLDDAYIHLRIADNIANYGVWGVNADEFSSASSSILYTLILALTIFVFGNHVMIPLILNVLAALVLFIFIGKKLDLQSQPLRALFLFSGLILLVPLGPIVMSGMEHTLQLLINCVFIWSTVVFLKDESGKLGREFWIMALFGFLSVCIRFEGLFLAVVPGLYLLFDKKIKAFVILFLAFCLPVIIFGWYSVSNGGMFLPNSLLIKGDRPDLSIAGVFAYCFQAIIKLVKAPHLALFMVASVVWLIHLISIRTSWKSNQVILLSSGIVATSIHLLLAKTGWFYRYEAYLMMIFIVTFCLEFDPKIIFNTKKSWIKIGLLVLVGLSLSILMFRGIRAYPRIPVAMKNIHDQQIQMANFLTSSYPTAQIAANDIGAITYFNSIHLTDLFGLGDTDIARWKYSKSYDQSKIDRISKDQSVEIAIIYESWFPDMVPDEWIKVGQWKIRENYICGSEVVSFYATKESCKERLAQNLVLFSPNLPNDVEESGMYISNSD